MSDFLKFPQGFHWGTATSAHQVEGNNIHSDWWKAEQEGKVPHKSERACGSYNRYEEDLDLAKSMHTNAHRFSIEWARIEPEEGKFMEEEIEHYRKVIRAAKERGLEPFITLHHFTNPQWFMEKGGWINKKAPEYFERYVKFVISRLGNDARYWVTINEPLIVLSKGYWEGSWPPFRTKDIAEFFSATKNMVRAHKKSYRIIHEANERSFVGLAHQLNYLEPGGSGIIRIINSPFAKIADYWKNYRFIDAIEPDQDFIGINYYNHYFLHIFLGKYQDKNAEKSDFGWAIYPKGIYHLAKDAFTRYQKPIFFLENGIADAKDAHRSAFIQRHVRWLHKAIAEGADVRGYFHWSLLDNFEWAEGFNMKFGLVEVDFNTFKRTLRPSSKVYAEICKNNAIEIPRDNGEINPSTSSG